MKDLDFSLSHTGDDDQTYTFDWGPKPTQVKIKPLYPDTQIPTKPNPTDACYDLYAHSVFKVVDGEGIEEVLPTEHQGQQTWVLSPMEGYLVKVGFAMALPEGWEAQIRPRSGLALKKFLTVTNSPGTIDANFRGQVGVIMRAGKKLGARIFKGERVAQMAIKRVPEVELIVVDELDETDRGDGGFGSSGRA